MSRRSERVASTLMKLLQERLARGLNDPRIRGLITITRVELVEDMDFADVYVTVLPDEHTSLTMHGLRAAAASVRRDVMPRMHIRDMPRLRFKLDQGLIEQRRIMDLLARARHEAPSWGVGDAAEPDAGAPGDPDAVDGREPDLGPGVDNGPRSDEGPGSDEFDAAGGTGADPRATDAAPADPDGPAEPAKDGDRIGPEGAGSADGSWDDGARGMGA